MGAGHVGKKAADGVTGRLFRWRKKRPPHREGLQVNREREVGTVQDTRLGVERVEPHPFVGEVPSHGVGVEGGELVADGEGQSVVDAGGDAHAQLEGMDAPLVAADVVIVGRDARYPVVACDVYPFVGDVQQQSGFSGEMEVREVCPQEGRGHEEDRRTEVRGWWGTQGRR